MDIKLFHLLLRNVCVIDEHEHVPFIIITIWSFCIQDVSSGLYQD